MTFSFMVHILLYIPLSSHALPYDLPPIDQDVLHHHSSRPCPLGSVPHPRTISHHLLIHRKWHANLPRLLNTRCSNKDCHIHPSGLHGDPNASPFDRDTYLHGHSTRSRNRIDRRRNTPVRSSDSAICCARRRSTCGDTWLYRISADTRGRIDPGRHIYTFPRPHRCRNASRRVDCSS